MTITIHMVASLDGYIAKPDNSIGWMDSQDSHDHCADAGRTVVRD